MTKIKAPNSGNVAHPNKKILKGGWGENLGFAPCTELSQFKITDNSLNSFNREFASATDCFINVLQIIGMFDNATANILRITHLGRNRGFTQEEIELIFMYRVDKNFNFTETSSWNQFETVLTQSLKPGHVTVAGYTNHVFLIGRTLSGVFIYIDPQGKGENGYCPLNECFHLIKDHQTKWFLLFNSTTSLTKEQQQTIIQYISEPPLYAPKIENSPIPMPMSISPTKSKSKTKSKTHSKSKTQTRKRSRSRSRSKSKSRSKSRSRSRSKSKSPDKKIQRVESLDDIEDYL